MQIDVSFAFEVHMQNVQVMLICEEARVCNSNESQVTLDVVLLPMLGSSLKVFTY